MNTKAWGRRAKVGFVAALVVLIAFSVLANRTAEANTGCPDSTSSLGDITLSGTCTIDGTTTWENGSITIAGDVNANAPLTMNNVFIYFDTSANDQYEFVAYDDLSMSGGGAWSLGGHRWRMATAFGQVVIDGSEFAHGHYDFSGSEADIGYSTFRDSTNVNDQHISIGANSNIHHNTLLAVSVAEQAAIFTYNNYGNSKIWGNELHLNCYGSNCMGIETRNMQGDVYPGFPVVEIAWNNITWEDIGGGDWAITLDNEYSSGLYMHNNTQYNGASESIGACLQGGGVRGQSVYEYNTCWGPQTHGIYRYIYTDSEDTVMRYNFFSDTGYAMVEFGNGIIAHNTWEDVTNQPFRICGDTDYACAGGATNPRDFAWYNNTVTWSSGGYVGRMSDENDQYNIVNQHGDPDNGITQWRQDQPNDYHTVLGEGAWLYKADASIDSLLFQNTSGGTRWVNMTVGGKLYEAHDPSFGTTDTASLLIDGPIDQSGSMNINDNAVGTFLWALSPVKTEVDVLATGSFTLTVDDFAPDWDYSVSILDYGNSQTDTQTFTTDGGGQGSFSVTSAGHYRVTIDSVGTPPSPPDESPPAQVTDLEAVDVGADYALLQWEAPGDDGSVGQAATYDIRYSTTGPLDDANFGGATPVPVQPPIPGPSGATETLNVTGLSPETEYWFALRTADEVPNWSPVSNNVNIVTSSVAPPDDESPPAQVTDLVVVVTNSDYAILQWEAPGDDGTMGQAATYDVRYSTAGPLNDSNFDSAASVPVGVPPPASPGSTERLNVSGLSPGTEYWFALRTADEVPNWSPVSNSVNTTTPLEEVEVDDTPPTVTITSPSDGSVIQGALLVVINAVDDTAIEEVVLALDGTEVATFDVAPYHWVWDPETTTAGWHTLRAEATDPSGNTGGHEVHVTVLPSGNTPETAPPTVEYISYDPSEGRFDIRFSKLMDRISVQQALSIVPQIAYTTSWQDDSNITVLLEESTYQNTTYTLTIDETAADQEGLTLTESFTFSFDGNGSGPGGGTTNIGDLWLQIAVALAAAWAIVLGLLLWSRHGIRRLRTNVRQLATHIEDLDSKSSTPEEIKVYHRY